MKKTYFMAGIVLVLGLAFVACDTPANNNMGGDVSHGYDANDYIWNEDVENIFIRVAGGTFQMGSPDGVGNQNERPMRAVTVSAFYISRFPITQGQWYDVMGTNPSTFTFLRSNWRNLPMEGVSWIQAARFANALSLREGLTPAYSITGITGVNATLVAGANGFRLPTEAQWEFAAGGGTLCNNNFTFSGSNDHEEVAWYSGNRQRAGTHEVGLLQPNALGLFDMTGNVWEWTQDWYGAYPPGPATNPTGPADAGQRSRVIRGGSWASTESNLRIVVRDNIYPAFLGGSIGFRLVRP
ncbi:MAG: formylglycine-generating enzyme family protein [Treponema sp.]|nr:formylglycine-generating enzyme family protein [Treponema sp.]